MELEFDKEIDAILRKGRTGIAVAAAKSAHLDADSIAAFAENALPQKTKLLYTQHFADCDSCRKMLSQAILMNTGADAAAALNAVAAPVVETSIPWYSKILRSPSLAIGMGALILAFVGVLGFLVVQNRKTNDVAEVREPNTAKAPAYQTESASNAASTDTAAANAANTATNSAIPSAPAANTSIGSNGHGTADGRSDGGALDGTFADAPADKEKSAVGGTSAAPPPPVAAQPAPMTERKEDAPKLAAEESRDLKRGKDEDDRVMTRDAVPSAAKKSIGPTRAAGPRQNQTNQGYEMNQQAVNDSVLAKNKAESAIKTAGGKKFTYRSGAWYDTAYNGQATKNVSRGSSEYSNLDSGLRSIGNQIGGVVVVVWKGSAYRIQ